MRSRGVAPTRRAARAGLLTGTLLLALLALVWATAPGAARGQGGVAAVTPTPVASPYFTVTPPAPAPPPLDFNSFTPGSYVVMPGGSVTFLDDVQGMPDNTPSGARLLKVINSGAQPAGVAYDGLTLVITGGLDYTQRAAIHLDVPGATCIPLDPGSARVGCSPVPGDPTRLVTFTTSPLPPVQPGTSYAPVRTFQSLAVPGQDTIAPLAQETLVSSASAVTSPNGGSQIYVAKLHNDGLDPIDLSDDGTRLTLSAPAGDVLEASGCTGYGAGCGGDPSQPLACSPGDTPNVLTCPDPPPPTTIDLLAEPASAFVAPGSATLYLDHSAAFATANGPLVVRYPQTHYGIYLYGAPASAVLLQWDGATLSVTGPARSSVTLDCASQSASDLPAGDSASCDLSQSAQTLITITTEMPHIAPPLPAPQPPQWLPAILSAPQNANIGDVLSFVGGAGGRNDFTIDGPFAYFWLWGDGTIDTGANATHVYADAGSYSVALVVVNLHDGTLQSATTTVTIAGP